MANEPTLRKIDIEDLEDRVTILEGGTPEPHSNTMTKPELEDLGDRITVLEGGTPGTRHNPMRFDFLTTAEERVEELEEEEPDKAILVVDLNGGIGSIYDSDFVERWEGEFDKGTSINLYQIVRSDLNFPEGALNLNCWTTIKDDLSSKIDNADDFTLTENTTVYAYYDWEYKHTITLDYNGATDTYGKSIKTELCADGTVYALPDPTTSGWTIPEGKEFGFWSDETLDPYHEFTSVTIDSDCTFYIIWKDPEPELVNISPQEEFNGFWIKPTINIDPTDPDVATVYDKLQEDPDNTVKASFYFEGNDNNGITVGNNSDTYSIRFQIIDSVNTIDVEYTRVEVASSIGLYDVYQLTGNTCHLPDGSIDLSTVTSPIYIPITYVGLVYVDESQSPNQAAPFACMFLFKEDTSR